MFGRQHTLKRAFAAARFARWQVVAACVLVCAGVQATDLAGLARSADLATTNTASAVSTDSSKQTPLTVSTALDGAELLLVEPRYSHGDTSLQELNVASPKFLIRVLDANGGVWLERLETVSASL